MRKSVRILFTLLLSILFPAMHAVAGNGNGLPTDLKAGLIMASPGNGVYTSLGHCAIRLQCPSRGFDYCYAYGMDDSWSNLLGVFAGTAKGGFFVAYTNPYLMEYADEGRGVTEYQLNLSLEQKRELWKNLDARISGGDEQPYDYTRNSCSAMCAYIVELSLLGERIDYHDLPQSLKGSFRDELLFVARDHPWTKLFWMGMLGTNGDKRIHDPEAAMMPEPLLMSWKQASLVDSNGVARPLLVGNGRLLVKPQPKMHWGFAPEWLFGMVLAIAVVLLVAERRKRWHKGVKVFDISLLAMQTLVALCVTFLELVSKQQPAHFSFYVLIFNPLPALAFLLLRRKPKAYGKAWLAFGLVCALFIVLTPIVPQIYFTIDLVAAAFAVRCWAAYRRYS